MDRIENIDYCIRYLLEQDHAQAEIPRKLCDKQQLLRALMNIWRPQPLALEFLQAQDSELQAQLSERGVVALRHIAEPGHSPFASPAIPILWQGDITRLKVDAIVNAANSRGLGCWHPLHACIDNAIHSAAGLQLRAECDRLMQGTLEPTGRARVTPAYNLPARFVIHTVGPIITAPQPTPEQEEQLASCYRACLQAAEEHGCRSLAFCCISTGEFRFPQRQAAQIALRTVVAHRGPSLQTVVFNVFRDSDYAIYRELLPEA
jgi:O-acetyl-ADP-ribose deacetylase (regulator of RNase III)